MAEVEDGGRRLRGVVRWFNGTKGYGFITPDDGGEDLFVHQSSIKSDGYRSLGEGETVEFVVEQSTDGRTKAVDVTGPDGSNVLGDRRGGSAGGGFGGRGERYGGGDRYGGGGGRGGGGYGFDGRSGRNGGGGPGACFNCGEMGHMARDCSQGGRGGGGGGRYGGNGGGGGGGGGGGECFVCGEPGHFARECPNNSRN